MRALQYVAGVILIALLAVIAYDLHRVADAVQPTGALYVALFGTPHPANETLAEHDARLRRGAAAVQHDLDVVLGPSILDKPKQTPRASGSSR